MQFQGELSISTSGHGHMTDLTDPLARLVQQSQIEDGIVNLFNVGSTAIITTIEFEPGLEQDLPEMLSKLIPPGRHYGHEKAWQDGNAHSHLQASILGPGLTVPLRSGELLLGTWQQIVHLECDVKPRERTIIVTILS